MLVVAGEQEEVAILIISRLLLHVLHVQLYVANIILFGLPLRMNGMHRMQLDRAGFGLLHLVL